METINNRLINIDKQMLADIEGSYLSIYKIKKDSKPFLNLIEKNSPENCEMTMIFEYFFFRWIRERKKIFHFKGRFTYQFKIKNIYIYIYLKLIIFKTIV